jgi:ferredoxin-NADP reductase
MMNLPKPQQYTARLSEKKVYNPKFEEYIFELVWPNKLEFKAGQYVSFLVSDQGHRRSWSISSSPAVDHRFEIVIDPAPMGMGTKFLQALEPGDEVSILAPLGQFVVDEGSKEEAIVFVATGVGIAPFHSMIADLLQVKKETRPIVLHWGLRHVDDMIWQDEFQQYAEDFDNFRFHPVISRASQEWPLCRGRVTDCLGIHDLPENAGYYLCGSDQMISDVKEVLISKGVAPERIHREKFY